MKRTIQSLYRLSQGPRFTNLVLLALALFFLVQGATWMLTYRSTLHAPGWAVGAETEISLGVVALMFSYWWPPDKDA